ncbi:MAG: hypothetical protein ACLT38_10880 [Akkermansia sp.]
MRIKMTVKALDAEQAPGQTEYVEHFRPNAKNALSEVTKITRFTAEVFRTAIIEGREGIMIIAPFVPKETIAENHDLYRKAENSQSRLL